MKRKFLMVLLAVGIALLNGFALSSCNNQTQNESTAFEEVYGQYVVYAETQGKTPLSYEEWLATIKGEQGNTVESIEMDSDGNFIITYTDGTTQVIELPKAEEHVHSFGDWINYSTAETSCEERLLYRLCSACSSIEWQQGTYNDHDWTVETVQQPNHYWGGYDVKTCNICGKQEIENETEKIDYVWSTTYSSDNDYHWFDCLCGCGSRKDESVHQLDNTKKCTVCKKSVEYTKGVVYAISADKKYAEVTGYTGSSSVVYIADTYNGLPVKAIREKAFYEKSINYAILPDGVVSIGEQAFAFCGGLDIVIPDSMETIGLLAFYETWLKFTEYDNCKYLGNINNPYVALIDATYYNGDTLTLHEKTKVIAARAFEETNITEITLPYGMKSIGDRAFEYCSSLTSIKISDSVTSIGDYAFYSCSGLTSIKIPNGIKEIGDYVFENCTGLTKIVLPDGVTSIGKNAFMYCYNLTSVVIPKTVTKIGQWAFSDCYGLKKVYYGGTENEWNQIANEYVSGYLDSATRYYYIENESDVPNDGRNYWHYNANGEVAIW